MQQTLTDQTLQEKLKNSQLSPEDKKAIEPYVSRMDQGEREELVELINKGETIHKTMEDNAQKRNEADREALAGLKKVRTAMQKKATREFEKISREEDQAALKNIV